MGDHALAGSSRTLARRSATTSGRTATTAQLAIVEHIAFLELRAALLSQKIIDGTYTNYDSSTHYALIGALRRCYREIGIESPTPKLAELLR